MVMTLQRINQQLIRADRENYSKLANGTYPVVPSSWTFAGYYASLFRTSLVLGDRHTPTEYGVATFSPGSGKTTTYYRSTMYRNTRSTSWDQRTRFGASASLASFPNSVSSSILEYCEQSLAVGVVGAHASLAETIAEALETAQWIISRTNLLARLTRLASHGKFKKMWKVFKEEFGAFKPTDPRRKLKDGVLQDPSRYARARNEARNAERKTAHGGDSSSTAANGVLEYNYALKPVMDDIATLADIYNGLMSKYSSSYVIVKGKGQESSKNGPVLVNTTTISSSSVSTFKFKGKWKVDAATLAGVTLLGLTNVPAAIWGKGKLTFVVDWVLPIGDWLTTLTPTWGLDPIGAYVSVKTYEIHDNYLEGVRLQPGFVEVFQRRVLAPRAHFNVHSPFSSLTHVAVTASLIRTNRRIIHSL